MQAVKTNRPASSVNSTNKIFYIIIILVSIVIFCVTLYVYFINVQAKNGSILIQKGSFQDFLIFDKKGMTYYNPVTKSFEK